MIPFRDILSSIIQNVRGFDKVERDIQFTIDREEKLSMFLKRQLFSRNLFFDSVRRGALMINGHVIDHDMYVHFGDELRYTIPKEKNRFTFDRTPINVLYEDEEVLVIDKPANLSMMPDKGEGSVAERVAYLFYERKIESKVRFVTRLDKDTSGIVLIAKHAYAHGRLMKEDDRGNIHKFYTALLKGIVNEEVLIDKPILREKWEPKSYVDSKGKQARTRIIPIHSSETMSLVKIELLTGRTHQIRVHAASIGHPVIGDPLYGDYGRGGQYLHASEIAFPSRAGNVISVSAHCRASMLEQVRVLNGDK